MRSTAIFLLIAAAFAATNAEAKKAPTAALYPCMETLKGKSITITPFEAIADAVPVVSPKDQFETTAQYEARKAAASPQLPSGPLFMRVESGGRNNQLLKYDADRSAFIIDQDVLGGSSFRWGYSVFKVYVPENRYVGALLKSTKNITGSYKASNAFGAKTEVTTVDVTDHVIVEGYGKLDYGVSTLLPGTAASAKGYLAVPQETAKDLSPRLRAAIMFTLKAPYFVTDVLDGSEPTFNDPIKTREITKAIVADMHCSLIYDIADNSVIWAFPTY